MYQEKMEKILLVNSYLTKCKIQNPNSSISRAAQKYLTRQINQTLKDIYLCTPKTNGKKQSFYSFIPMFSFLFIR